jgi:hypothetical protein
MINFLTLVIHVPAVEVYARTNRQLRVEKFNYLKLVPADKL